MTWFGGFSTPICCSFATAAEAADQLAKFEAEFRTNPAKHVRAGALVFEGDKCSIDNSLDVPELVTSSERVKVPCPPRSETWDEDKGTWRPRT